MYANRCVFICFQHTFVDSHACPAADSWTTFPMPSHWRQSYARKIQFICFESEKYACPTGVFLSDAKKRYVQNPRDPVKSCFNGSEFEFFFFFVYSTGSPFLFHFVSFVFFELKHFVRYSIRVCVFSVWFVL